MKQSWLKENKGDLAIKFILFLIAPFLSALYSVKRINTKSSFRVFFGFALFFGMSFSVDLDSDFDGATYRQRFEGYSEVTYFEFIQNLLDYLSFNTDKKDYYFDTLFFLISRFTDNYHVMFMFAAIIFAFFALKSLKFLTSEENFDSTLSNYILVFLFMSNQIFNINGLRMWTAAWIGVYALFQIFKQDNKAYFLLLILTPFFHGSFWVLIGVSVLAYFFKRYDKVWSILFLISFFVGSVTMELIAIFSDLLPTVLQNYITVYTDDGYIQSRHEAIANSTTIKYFRTFESVLVNFMVYLFIINSKDIKSNFKTKNIYQFLLVLMTFINFTMFIPSLGGRYVILAYPIIAYIWLVSFKNRYEKYRITLYLLPIVFSFSIFQLITNYLEVIDLSFLISSPFYIIYKYLS